MSEASMKARPPFAEGFVVIDGGTAAAECGAASVVEFGAQEAPEAPAAEEQDAPETQDAPDTSDAPEAQRPSEMQQACADGAAPERNPLFRGKPWPAFVCTGFQKCGTTTLFGILSQHPDVALCRDVKEPMYYRVLGLRRIGGKRYYQARYYGHLQAGERRLVGEVNAGLNFTACAEKVARDFGPETKFVFMMRNPVERSYSAYRYFLARGFLPFHVVRYDRKLGHARAFDRYVHEVLDNPSHRACIMRKRLKYLVFSQSNYARCIREYLQHYPLGNMHFMVFEEFVDDQHAACRELYDFLGVDDAPDIDYARHANCKPERAVSGPHAKLMQWAKGFVHYAFDEFLAMRHWAPRLSAWCERRYQGLRRRCVKPDEDGAKMLPITRAYLQDYYNDEVRDLEVLLNRDLSEIWF